MGGSWSQEGEGSSSNQNPQVIPFNHSEAINNSQKSGELHVTSATTPSVGTNNKNNNTNIKNEIKGVGAIRESIKLPHNYEAIIKDSDSPIVDKSSPQKLLQQLHAGVYLNGRKMKYWVEKKGNINCFVVFARGLSITWGENETHWYFHDVETRYGQINVAALRNVCWLEVHGKFNSMNLTPGVTYEVAYLIKLESSSYGWEVPVNFRLTLPNKSKQEHKENLKEKPRDEWIRIPVGEFRACPENLGEIEFYLYEYEGGNWKKGLIILGVTIEPKF